MPTVRTHMALLEPRLNTLHVERVTARQLVRHAVSFHIRQANTTCRLLPNHYILNLGHAFSRNAQLLALHIGFASP